MQSSTDKNYRDKREENLERRHVYSYTDEEFFASLPAPTYGHDICYYHRYTDNREKGKSYQSYRRYSQFTLANLPNPDMPNWWPDINGSPPTDWNDDDLSWYDRSQWSSEPENSLFNHGGCAYLSEWEYRSFSTKDLMRATKLYEYCPKTKSKRSGVPLLSTRDRRCVWFFCNEYREVTEEKEYACDLVKLSKLPLYNKLSIKIGPLDSHYCEGYEKFEELVANDICVFLNNSIPMSIRRLEIRINANTPRDSWEQDLNSDEKRAEIVSRGMRPPSTGKRGRKKIPLGVRPREDISINMLMDPWTIPRKKWYAFRVGNTDEVEEKLLCLLMSSLPLPCHNLVSSLEAYRIYEQLRKRRNKEGSLTPEEEDTVTKMHPLYLKYRKVKHLEKVLEKSRQVDREDEDRWRRNLLPKRSDYSLVEPVLAFREGRVIGRYSHQCMFCEELFTHYPLLHMRMCMKQLDAPLSLLKAYLKERQLYYELFIDDWIMAEDNILPRNEVTKRLIKPVYNLCGKLPIKYNHRYFGRLPEPGLTDETFLYYYQCQYCKEIHQTYALLTKHVSECKSQSIDANTNERIHQKTLRITWTKFEKFWTVGGRSHQLCDCEWANRLDRINDRHPVTCSKWLCRPCCTDDSSNSTTTTTTS